MEWEFIQGRNSCMRNVCFMQETLAKGIRHKPRHECTDMAYVHLQSNIGQRHATSTKAFKYQIYHVHILLENVCNHLSVSTRKY